MVTDCFVILFNSKEGNAELSAKGSSNTFTNWGIISKISVALQIVSVCSEPIIFAYSAAILLSSYSGSSKPIENVLIGSFETAEAILDIRAESIPPERNDPKGTSACNLIFTASFNRLCNFSLASL
ncbi:hypothetical protein D3C86_1456420 [compost metagenome]